MKSDGDFEDILAADKPDVWESNRPAKGGEAGAMLATIIERAARAEGRQGNRRRRRRPRQHRRKVGAGAEGRSAAAKTAGPWTKPPGRRRRPRTEGDAGGERPAARKATASAKRTAAQRAAFRETNMNKNDYILFSGGAPGAEAEFGACAERHGIEEVNFTFDGHIEARRRGVRVLNHEELQAGDVSLEYVSRLMNRRYTDSPTDPQGAADAVVPGQQRAGDLRRRRHPGRRDRARRHRLGRRVRQAL